MIDMLALATLALACPASMDHHTRPYALACSASIGHHTRPYALACPASKDHHTRPYALACPASMDCHTMPYALACPNNIDHTRPYAVAHPDTITRKLLWFKVGILHITKTMFIVTRSEVWPSLVNLNQFPPFCLNKLAFKEKNSFNETTYSSLD